MKSFTKIITFGDSFAWGDELVAPDQTAPGDYGNREYREKYCYTGLVAEHYGVPAENLAFPGGSCQSTRWIYTWWLQQEPDPASCLVLAQLSGPWRTSQFDQRRQPQTGDHAWNRFIHSTWWQSYREQDQAAFHYFDLEEQLSDCDERSNLIQAETYLFFQAQQSRFSGLLMFNSQPFDSQHSIQPDNLLWHGTALQDLIKQPEYQAPRGHFNENGHGRISEMLIQEIDRVILAE